MQYGQTLFAAVDIPRGSLSQFRSAGPDAKQVIAYLESDAHCIAKAPQAGDSFYIVCSEQGSHLSGTAHQRGGLAANHIHVHRKRNVSKSFKADVEVLTLRDHKAGFVKHGPKTDSDGGINPFTYHIPEREAGEGKHAIPCIDRLWNTPDIPHR